MCDTLYVVIPCFNEEEVLHETAKRLDEKIRGMIEQGLVSKNSKVFFVNDGSKDSTWEIITQLHNDDKLFSGLSLSHNSGEQNAYMAGMMAVKKYADMVITLDADLQDDIDAIDKMVIEYNRGNEIVFGVRSTRKKDAFFKRFTAEGFYKLLDIMGVEIVFNHSDYRLMSKRALEELSKYTEKGLFLRGMVPLIGLRSEKIYYERNERFAGKSKYPLKKMLSLALEAITSFSMKPIQLIGLFAAISLFASVSGIIAMIVQEISTGIISTWLIIFTSLWTIGGFQMLAIRIIGEYIGKIYREVKNRPRYIIAENLLDEHKRML